MNEQEAQQHLTTQYNVSRETMAGLAQYAALLAQWNPKINLVSKTTLNQVWVRHILDSAQLWNHIPNQAQRLTDIGSGAGFPGLVLAVMAAQFKPQLCVTLIESDMRKCAFMRAVARELGLDVTIVSQRIEQATPPRADVVTARALAPVAQLLNYVPKLLLDDGVCLFLKGESCATEVEAARKNNQFNATMIKSETSPKGMILRVTSIVQGQ